MRINFPFYQEFELNLAIWRVGPARWWPARPAIRGDQGWSLEDRGDVPMGARRQGRGPRHRDGVRPELVATGSA
jgi:hypothetical protein